MDVDTVKSEEILLEALKEIIPSLRSSSNKMIASKFGKEKLSEAAKDVAEFIQAGVSAPLKHNEQFALTVKILHFLSRYLRKTLEIPVTLNTVSTHLNLLPDVVDSCFPSYHESKLLRYIITPQQLRA